MDNKVISSGIKNIVYVLLAQVISLALSFLTSFILPISLGITQFGYWQVYLFYTGYLGLFCIGFNDGLYLRYGKYDYKDLPFSLLRTSLRIFLTIQVLLTIFTIGLILFESNSDKTFAFVMTAVNIVIMGLNGTLTMVYQFTNRIKLYSISTVLNKVLLLVSIGALLLFNITNYKYVIIADTIIKVAVLIFNIYFCKELIFGKATSMWYGFKEMQENMQVGISLMIANLMGMLVMGLGRFIVERFMSIEEYGLYSFAISSTNLTLLFISSVSLALYPMLKRLPENDIPKYYGKINVLLCTLIFGMLGMYFPIYWVVKSIMPAYAPILEYLYILFPIVVAQGKMQLLINTYYKALREEKAMLKANISSVMLFLVTAIPTFYFFRSVTLIALCTLITMLWRCYASEVYLKKKMRLTGFTNIVEELIVIVFFIIVATLEHKTIGFVGYNLIFVAYFLRHHKEILSYTSGFSKLIRPKQSKEV